jgi:cytosine/adenosine deaminase-related metal-dependent hydrolase/ubiquinone/menaquinone biosynthesis C-methylase UbiE
MPTSSPSRFVSPKEAHALWSRTYDSHPNPMLALEERYLECMLPSLANSDVVDLGCGTGRWLARLADRGCSSLVGIDSSPEMLAQAAWKLAGKAHLFIGDCERPPLPENSANLVLCSFVGSYIDDFKQFATQAARLLRPGGSLVYTDLHPETVERLGWRRGFSHEGVQVDIAAHSRSLESLVTLFAEAGLQLDAVLEPHFAEPELEIFEKAGKSAAFHDAALHPAIFLMQLQKRPHKSLQPCNPSPATDLQFIRGACIALGPSESLRADIRVSNERIEFIDRNNFAVGESATPSDTRIDLEGCLLLPGLINAHDHLEFALFPRLGRGDYRNFAEWAEDIYLPDASPVREQRAVPKETRLWWGAIRNLLCGVTTVCHHNPYAPEVFEKDFPIRVLRDFGWAHSTIIDSDFARKFYETPLDQPFIIHLGEGIDSQSAEEILELFEHRALDARTVIVHGLGLDEQGRDLLRSSGAALVWCPSSNVFLFGRTLDREILDAFPRLALGSDSPLTAQGDLLDELRFAQSETGLPAETLYDLVTTSPAELLQLKSGAGTLRVNSAADFIAVRDRGDSPSRTLASLSFRDIELVVVGGRINLASPELLQRVPPALSDGLEPLDIDGTIRWIRAPVSHLIASAQHHLPDTLKLGGRKVRDAALS